MAKYIKIGRTTIKFVFRHLWEKEKDATERLFTSKMEFRNKALGLFWRKDMAIGSKKTGKAMFDGDNLVPCYMIGLNLIWAKTWITIDRGVMHFEL